MAFDVKIQDFSKSAEVGYEFELKLPTGAGSEAYLTVIGAQSPTVKQYAKRKFQEYQQRQQIAKRKGKEEEISLDEAEELAVEGALVRLVGWRGITEEGKEVKFSKDKAREILTQHPWIREQIMEESDFVGNFVPKI
jgi:hypothetical protein